MQKHVETKRMSEVRYMDDDDEISYQNSNSNTELMVYGDMYSSTSWPRYQQADHVQAILNLSEAYLHAASTYQDDRSARLSNTWSVQQKKSANGSHHKARRTYSADRAPLRDPILRTYSAGPEWRRRSTCDNSETEDEEQEVTNLEINDHLARCQCTCDHLGYTRNSRRQFQQHRGLEDNNGNSSMYQPETSRIHSKPEVAFYVQGSSTPSSTSVASGTLLLIGAPRRWLAVLAVLLIAVGVGVGVPLALRSGSDTSTSLQERLELATRLLHEVPLVDGHNDLPWNIRKFLHNRLRDFRFGEDLRKVIPWSNSPWSHTDLPRLRAGLVAAQFWAAYVPCESQFLDAVQLTLEQIDVIRRLTEKYHPSLIPCTSVADIKAAHAQGRVCSLIGVEGGHSLASSLPVLRTLYSVGVRYLTLTSNCNTPWADSQLVDTPGKKPEHNGLTNFGKNVVKEMNRLGMLVDLAHVAVHTMLAALEVSKAPVIFSHSSARALCNTTRNVPDHVLRLVALKGGLVMINFYSQFLTCRKKATADDAIAHINHVRKVAGVDSVGLGAGYDGINLTPEGLEDVSSYPTLFAALIGTGKWSIDDLKKLAGLNFLRVMQEVEKVRDAMKAAGVGPYEDDDNNIRRSQKNCSSINLF